MSGPAARLPQNAPAGGIEPVIQKNVVEYRADLWSYSYVLVHDSIYLLGSNSGLLSSIDGTAGDEYPRTRPMQKYDIDTHNESIV